jgi:hypothetical protein
MGPEHSALLALSVGLFIRGQLEASWPSPDLIRGLTRPPTRTPSPPYQALNLNNYPYRCATVEPGDVDGRLKAGHDGGGSINS